MECLFCALLAAAYSARSVYTTFSSYMMQYGNVCLECTCDILQKNRVCTSSLIEHDIRDGSFIIGCMLLRNVLLLLLLSIVIIIIVYRKAYMALTQLKSY